MNKFLYSYLGIYIYIYNIYSYKKAEVTGREKDETVEGKMLNFLIGLNKRNA